jgi:adenylate cyclase
MTGMNTMNTNLAILIAHVSNREELPKYNENNVVDVNLRFCHERILKIMDKYEGNLVRNTGDRIICSFVSVNYAANAAIKMNRELNTNLIDMGDNNVMDTALSVHVGIHYGETIMDSNDIYGDAVNIASQLVDLAQKEYIFTTGSTVELLSPELQELAYFVKSINLKSDPENIELFEINWKQLQ